MIGLTLRGATPAATVELIAEADAAGIDAVWLQAGGVSADPLTLFAAGATRSTRVQLGTAIIPTWPRHPLALAQQALVVESLAPGRLVLGVGSSTPGAMRAFGVDFHHPLAHVREFVAILREALHTGATRVEGAHLSARARLAAAPGTPVMVSALQEGSFELAGELSDGAITWLCPPDYVRTRGTPALERGAERAGRERPPIVLHLLVCQDTDPVRVAEAASTSFGAYTQFEFYRDMFAAAGHPPSSEPRFSPDLVDALVVYGTEDEIRARIETLGHEFEHLMVSTVPTVDGRNVDATRSAIQLLARMQS